MGTAQPVAASERIHAIDIIRGFALFGVLWMNLYEHRGLVFPYDALDDLATAALDQWIGFASQWLMQGKAQALFSLLFGFGFANIMERLEARGAPPRVFLRRIAILLVFGLIDVFMLWIGDILHAYALMGFLLYFTRHWSTRSLILVGLPLALLGQIVMMAAVQLVWDGEMPWSQLWDEGTAIRAEVYLHGDYAAFVAEGVRSTWVEWWSKPVVLPFLAQIFGRFLLGSWLFRKGWLSNPAAHRQVFAVTARVALPLGLVLSGLWAATSYFEVLPGWAGNSLSQVGALALACGYGAGIVLLHLAGRLRLLFTGFQAVGRMALTNYIMQSFFYLFAIYGFGLGLMQWLGATLSLGLALAFFAVQMGFSHWWLARYRFGPLEWLWRSLTYGHRQPMRLQQAAARTG